jgi:hypothetical protein
MPKPSRAFVQASILYLCLGAVLGALLLINRWIPLGSIIPPLRASHIEMLVVGWMTQLIIGVAWWLFPPLASGLRPGASRPMRSGQALRGSEPLFWTTFVCLNVGVLLRALCEPVYSWSQIGVFNLLAGISGLFLFVAAVAFVVNIWNRVRELKRGT